MGKLGLILMGWAIISKSLIQFSPVGQDRVPSLLFDLRPNYGVGNEDNGNLKEKAKWLPGDALQIVEKRREVKSKGERKDISI